MDSVPRQGTRFTAWLVLGVVRDVVKGAEGTRAVRGRNRHVFLVVLRFIG
jgi:hypothetical protein